MLYVFESSDGLIYHSPDAYVLSQKNQTILWGDTLKVYPVYQKGKVAYGDYQQIYAMFNHEGSFGGADDIQWIPSKDHTVAWYQGLDSDIVPLNTKKIVRFDVGSGYPKYFESCGDLLWYIGNIYDIDEPDVNDGYSFDDKIPHD